MEATPRGSSPEAKGMLNNGLIDEFALSFLSNESVSQNRAKWKVG